MSILGFAPFYLLAAKRTDNLIDYALMNPRGWVPDEIRHVSKTGARDEEQMLGRVQNLVPPWQGDIEIKWIDLAALRTLIASSTKASGEAK